MGRLVTGWVPGDRIRSYRVRFTAISSVPAEPTCSGRGLGCGRAVPTRGRVIAIQELVGERRATLELAVTLSDGTVTLVGAAIVAL